MSKTGDAVWSNFEEGKLWSWCWLPQHKGPKCHPLHRAPLCEKSKTKSCLLSYHFSPAAHEVEFLRKPSHRLEHRSVVENWAGMRHPCLLISALLTTQDPGPSLGLRSYGAFLSQALPSPRMTQKKYHLFAWWPLPSAPQYRQWVGGVMVTATFSKEPDSCSWYLSSLQWKLAQQLLKETDRLGQPPLPNSSLCLPHFSHSCQFE